MAKPLRFEVERVPFSVDQNKSYFLRLAGNSKALIYGRPQSQFSGELFTTLASALPGRADGAAEPVEPLAAQKRTGGFALAPETIPCAFLGRNKHRRGRRTGEKKA